METIPLQPIQNQAVHVTLAEQACTIVLRQRDPGLFVDLYVNNALVVGGVIAQNINRIVRDTYRGFAGDLLFEDSQQDADPYYSGLGSRWVLCYLSPADIAAA